MHAVVLLAPPGALLRELYIATITMHISEERNFVLYFTEGNYKAALHRQTYLMWRTHRMVHGHGDLVPFRVLLCHQALTLKPLHGGSVVLLLFV